MRSRWFDLSGPPADQAPVDQTPADETPADPTAADESSAEAPAAAAEAGPPLPPPTPETAERRMALLIGNAAYASAALENPVRDVRLLAWTLEGMGFSVRRVENASLTQMQDAVVGFGEALDHAGPETVALLYFAGHGVQYEGGNFLLPVDARIPAPHYLATRSLPLDVAVAQLARSPRRATIVAIDACRDEVVATVDEAAGVTAGLARAKLPRPSQLVFSTAARARAADGWGDHSPFALALSEELPGLLVPGRRLQDMIDDVATKVGLWTREAQTVAVYREGFMPPLALTDADEERLRGWSRRPPFRLSRRQAVRRIVAAMAALVAVVAAGLWWSAYPETRTTLMLRAGLLDGAPYDFTCAAPWDGAPDRYGLTRADWCLSLLMKLREKVAGKPQIAKAVATGLRDGDPRAVFLAALLASDEADRLTGEAREAREREAYALAKRAARTDLPVGTVAPFLIAPAAYTAEVGQGAVVTAMREAAARGVLVAAVLGPIVEANRRSGGLGAAAPETLAEVDAALRRADARDPTGTVAFTAARVFNGFGDFPALASPERERFWLRRAAAAGYRPAADLVANWRGRDPATRLEDGERERLVALLAGGDDVFALYWQARQRIERDNAIGPEAVRLLKVASDKGFVPATLELSGYYLDQNRDPAAAVALLRIAAKAGQPAAIRRLAHLLADGVTVDGKEIVKPQPQEARALLERPEMADDPVALFQLARLYRRGDVAARDPQRAETLLRKVERLTPDPEIGLQARSELERIATERAVSRIVDPAVAIALGRADAPLALTIVALPGCASCGLDKLMQVVEPFLASGEAHLAIVPVWKDGRDADVEASMLAVCAAPDARADLFRRLVADAGDWRSLVDPDERARAFAGILNKDGPAPVDVVACLRKDGLRAALDRQRADALATTRLRTPPVLFIGGQRHEEADAMAADELSLLIRAQLPPKLDAGR